MATRCDAGQQGRALRRGNGSNLNDTGVGRSELDAVSRDEPPARNGHATATLGSKVVLFGGVTAAT